MGSYLIPRLVESGHEVLQVSRQQRSPYQPHGAWNQVRQVSIDRTSAEEAGTFGDQIAALQPDAVIDMICFTLASARHLVAALRGQIRHFLHCGTIWVHGPSTLVPTTESQPRRPFGDYGIQKAAIEAYLLEEAQRGHFPATNLHPGHIVGPGWVPLNPAGHFNPQVFVDLANGEEVALPNLGMETVHHVHADDVAHAFTQALAHWSSAIGESYLAMKGLLQGAIELKPTVRPEAQAVVETLHRHGIEIAMITGDHATPAHALAASLGIDRVFANVLPEEKARLVQELQEQGRHVLFVGDGINDSIALKQANISVSISGATTVATDTAQIVLMDGTLAQLNTLFELGRQYEVDLKN